MTHYDRGIIANLPAHLADAECPIEIFTIHEKTLIKQTCSCDRLRTYHHEGTDDGINLDIFIRIDESHVVTTETLVTRETSR